MTRRNVTPVFVEFQSATDMSRPNLETGDGFGSSPLGKRKKKSPCCDRVRPGGCAVSNIKRLQELTPLWAADRPPKSGLLAGSSGLFLSPCPLRGVAAPCSLTMVEKKKNRFVGLRGDESEYSSDGRRVVEVFMPCADLSGHQDLHFL